MSVTIPEAGPVGTAILATLDAGLTQAVYLGVRSGAAPCVVLFPPLGDVVSRNLADALTGLDLEFQVSAIGTGPQQAVWLADRARAALLAGPITVASRLLSRPRQVQAPQDPYPDNDVSPPLWLAPVRYRIRTDPS